MIHKRVRLPGTLLSLALILAHMAEGQVRIQGPDTAVNASPSNSTFHNFIIAMNSDVADLYTPPGEGLITEDPIYFHYGLVNGGFTGDWSASPEGGSFAPVEFRKVQNFHSFYSGDNGVLDIGFIGAESSDENVLGFSDDGAFTPLFSWNTGGGNPPMSYQLSLPGDFHLRLEHRNLTNPMEPGNQFNRDRFRIYQAYYNGQYTNEWLLSIADRNASGDGDFDDGFFYISGSVTPAAPEPTHIALMAILGTGAWILVKRRIRSRRSS